MKKILLFILSVVLAAFCLTACQSDEVKIENRVNEMITAFNTGDMEGVLDCYDAKTRNANKALLNIGSELFGMTGFDVGLADLFGLTVGLMSDGELLVVEDMQISVNSNGTRATVELTLNYKDVSNTDTVYQQLTMVKENGDWYVTP